VLLSAFFEEAIKRPRVFYLEFNERVYIVVFDERFYGVIFTTARENNYCCETVRGDEFMRTMIYIFYIIETDNIGEMDWLIP
jgi:hypothetical protein